MCSSDLEGAYATTKLVQHDNTFTDYRGGTIWRLAFTEGLNDTPMSSDSATTRTSSSPSTAKS